MPQKTRSLENRAPHRLAAAAFCVVLDSAMLVLLAVVTVVIAIGGGVVQLGALTISVRSVERPLWILTAAVCLRYTLRSYAPLLGMPRWPVERLIDAGITFAAAGFPRWVSRALASPARGLLVLGAAAILLKILIAWRYPGFFSGDDVEVHEMSLGLLFGRPWPAWDLRNPFFPIVFVYPAQRLALSLGAVTPETLVLAGRGVVALLSTAALPLTWLAARRLAPDDSRLAAMAVVLLGINKLFISFGSSELPRPVSTVFVVAAFLCLLRAGLLWTAAGGVLLGVAAAFRFSEAVFLVPALLMLDRQHAVQRGTVLVLGSAAASLAIITTGDLVYWDRPFASLEAIVDYTLIQRQSSRGYEAAWAYLTLVPTWSTVFFVLLAVAGTARRHPDSWWLWTPILLLSLLPHKESRYLIPIVPFLSIGAARGFLRAADWIRATPSPPGWRLWGRELFGPLFLLAVLHEAGGWRLVRSNEGIHLAQHLRTVATAGVAAQDMWRLGGRPYLWGHEPLVELTPALLEDELAAGRALRDVPFVALRARTARTRGDAVLAPLGFARDPAWTGEDYVLYRRAGRD